MQLPTTFRHPRPRPSSRPDPTRQERRQTRQQHIRALERVLGGSVGWGFDALSRRLSEMRRAQDDR